MDNKYPISKHGFQCLDYCYKPNTWIIHPTSFVPVTNHLENFCPINEYDGKNKRDGDIDQCKSSSVVKDKQLAEDLGRNILMPTNNFSNENFLKIYYKINSMEEALDWITENSFEPYYTRRRIMDTSIKAFGFDDIIVDVRMVNFYLESLRSKWIPKLYRRLWSFISIIEIKGEKNILIVPSKEKILTTKGNENDMTRLIKINYIRDKLAIYKHVDRALQKFIQSHKNKLDTIIVPSESIRDYLMAYYIVIIKETADRSDTLLKKAQKLKKKKNLTKK